MKKIALHSVPRSGSSWVGQIFNSSPHTAFRFQPLFSYAFKDYLSSDNSLKEINNFFQEIAKSNDSFLLQQDKIKKGIYPKFYKVDNITHIVYKEVRYHHILESLLKVDDEIIVVGLVRNPYAVINSFLNAPREFRKDLGWEEMQEWRYAKKKNLDKSEEFFGYEKWKEILFLFQKLQKQYPDRFYLLKYDNILVNTIAETKKLFEFCDIEFTKQTLDFIQESRKNDKQDVYSVYKSKDSDDDWKYKLNKQIVKEITDDLKKEGLLEYVEELN